MIFTSISKTDSESLTGGSVVLLILLGITVLISLFLLIGWLLWSQQKQIQAERAIWTAERQNWYLEKTDLMNRLMSRDPMTLQYLQSTSEIYTSDQPTTGMSDEEELRRFGLDLDGIGEEVLVDLKDLGLITDD